MPKKQDSQGVNPLFFVLVFVLMILLWFYAFLQAMQLYLSSEAAEMVLQAGQILKGEMSAFSRDAGFIELLIYLVSVKTAGIQPYAAVFAQACLFMQPSLSVLFVLITEKRFSLLSVLILIGSGSVASPERIRDVAPCAEMIAAVIIFLHFFSSLLREQSVRSWAGAAVFGAFAVRLIANRLQPAAGSDGLTGTVRAVLSAYGADFSGQKVLQPGAVKYFLAVLLLIVIVLCMCRAISALFGKEKKCFHEIVFAIAILLTLVYSISPLSGNAESKKQICLWIPYGGTVLLAFTLEKSAVMSMRLGQNRIPVRVLSGAALVIMICSEFSAVVFSRAAGPADRVVLYLNEHGFSYGYCEPSLRALFTVSSKGNITFSDMQDDPLNKFLILDEQSVPRDPAAETVFESAPYRILSASDAYE